MNDYEIPRYSKMDLREFWSTLVERKSKLTGQFELEQDKEQKQFLNGQIESLKMTIDQLEKAFALF